ncbi:MAG: hypothetical protein D6712_13835 [Chloroflexi bacterium]|nr:MAG: hypothetical protein D6712_13835 [Chloroflexota bacterium]
MGTKYLSPKVIGNKFIKRYEFQDEHGIPELVYVLISNPCARVTLNTRRFATLAAAIEYIEEQGFIPVILED